MSNQGSSLRKRGLSRIIDEIEETIIACQPYKEHECEYDKPRKSPAEFYFSDSAKFFATAIVTDDRKQCGKDSPQKAEHYRILTSEEVQP